MQDTLETGFGPWVREDPGEEPGSLSVFLLKGPMDRRGAGGVQSTAG